MAGFLRQPSGVQRSGISKSLRTRYCACRAGTCARRATVPAAQRGVSARLYTTPPLTGSTLLAAEILVQDTVVAARDGYPLPATVFTPEGTPHGAVLVASA